VQIPDGMFCIIVDQCSNAIQLQMVREYTVVVGVVVGVDACLQSRDNVSVLLGCDSAKEYSGAIP
jgi:hypothetical protein